MKNIGLAILVIGVALSAAYGSRLAPEIRADMTLSGAAQFHDKAAQTAFDAYCDARAEATLEPADLCPGDEAEPAAEAQPAKTLEAEIARRRDRVAARSQTSESLTGAVADARKAWLIALRAAVEPGARAQLSPPTPPEQRLASWFDDSGLIFLFGLLLVVVGAVIGRKAVKAELTRAQPAAADGSAPQDFGQLLQSLHDEIQAMVEEMRGMKAPGPPEFEHIKGHIETLQLERFELLIAARGRVQMKYGMAGFAEIFGPLSSGERRVNRAWSALVDHHWPEALASIEAATLDLERAHKVLDEQVRAHAA